MTTKKRVGVLISGRGSNLQALVKTSFEPGYPAEIVSVISNRPDAPGLGHAVSANIPHHVLDHTRFSSREAFDEALDGILKNAGVELICNAGFMRLLTEAFVESWRDRQLNIHPSLLPSFKGMNTHERVLEAGARVSGSTVHFLRHEMDTGPIIAQAAVPVLYADTPDSLERRVLKAEHQLYPFALKLVASGCVRVVAERVVGQPDRPFSHTGDALLMGPPLDFCDPA